jgi:hypothetical protein
MNSGWEISYSAEWDGWIVAINGSAVCDEHGKPSIYRPPRTISNITEYDAWRAQVFKSIARMSGLPCEIGAKHEP